MIFWHLGPTTLIVRYVFRDPAMDLRWVLAGSLLPDLIDKPWIAVSDAAAAQLPTVADTDGD